jgi:hypothetical protein
MWACQHISGVLQLQYQTPSHSASALVATDRHVSCWPCPSPLLLLRPIHRVPHWRLCWVGWLWTGLLRACIVGERPQRLRGKGVHGVVRTRTINLPCG